MGIYRVTATVQGIGGQTASAVATVAVISTPAHGPTITSFSPTQGPAGTHVTLTGNGFDLNPLNDIVLFSGSSQPAPIDGSSVTPTQIIAVVPFDAATGPIEVTASNGTVTSTNTFIVVVAAARSVITPADPKVAASGTVSFQFRNAITNVLIPDATWSVQEGDVWGTVDSAGNYIAPALVPDPPWAYIIAASRSDPRVVAIDVVTFDILSGDLNGDGKVDAQDLTAFLQVFLGVRLPTPREMAAGDTRPKPGLGGHPFGDGRLGADDLNWLFRRFLGLETVP